MSDEPKTNKNSREKQSSSSCCCGPFGCEMQNYI